MNENILSYILKNECIEYDGIDKKQRNIIIFLILLTSFIILTFLCITEGWMKADEYIDYLKTVEESNIAMFLGMVMFIGPSYNFLLTCLVSILAIPLKNIDFKIKKVLYSLPIFSIVFTIPAWFLSSYIANVFNIS